MTSNTVVATALRVKESSGLVADQDILHRYPEHFDSFWVADMWDVVALAARGVQLIEKWLVFVVTVVVAAAELDMEKWAVVVE